MDSVVVLNPGPSSTEMLRYFKLRYVRDLEPGRKLDPINVLYLSHEPAYAEASGLKVYDFEKIKEKLK